LGASTTKVLSELGQLPGVEVETMTTAEEA
jgi:hypothetical protein